MKRLSLAGWACLAAAALTSVSALTLKTQPRGRWDEWQLRFPKLARSSKETVFAALGDLSWMEFVDGRDHIRGRHAYDGTNMSKRANQDGRYYDHVSTVYAKHGEASAWANTSQGRHLWTADLLLAANLELQGKEPCSGECLQGYTAYQPRHFHPEMPSGAVTRFSNCTTQRQKRNNLTILLNEYYMQVGELEKNGTVSPRTLLSVVAATFANLAELHPFCDGNSRSRTLFLQTELVRVGGHPVVMQDNGWGVYYVHSLGELELNLKHGWCAWEFVAMRGKSPWAPFRNTYDPETQACVPPAMSFRSKELQLAHGAIDPSL